jgi:hypothetical protein
VTWTSSGLVRSGLTRLADARNAAISTEGRFDVAYNAAHALSLAACGASDIGRRTDISYFRCCPIHSVSAPRYGRFSQNATMCAIALNMGAGQTSGNDCLQT